ncbi:MAG: glycosyltransferase family 4 protein [Candidatus Paceibacterota bacterium]|jgi:glycosyltransferase involved in cell wall biosynthesis
MKVLMISTDRKIFEEKSAVRARMFDYARLFEQLEIVVFAKKVDKFKETQIASNCRAYPTNSLSSFFYVWSAIRVGRKVLKGGNDRFGVVTCQDPFETGLAGWFLAKRFNIKLNFQLHTDAFSSFFERESLKNKIRVWLARKLLPQANSVRVVSERIKQSLAFLLLKTEPVVLPIFVSPYSNPRIITENLHQKYPQFDFVILMASRLTREKNFSLALRSLASVIKTNPRIGLVIVGDGPEQKKIEKEILRLNLNENVVLEKWNNNLLAYYQTVDLFLLTSNYEGYGRTFIEAAQASCPILTTDVGIVGEILNENNSLICPIVNEECLSEKILWAFNNRTQLVKLAEKLKEELSKQVITDKEEYLEKYAKTLV